MSSMDPRFDPRMMRGGPGFDPRMAAGGAPRGYDPQMYQKHYPGNLCTNLVLLSRIY